MSFPNPLRSNSPIVRSYAAAQWSAADYHLLSGEVGLETDTGREKLGTGLKWSQTPYTSKVVSATAGITGATAVSNIVTVNQTAYDALSAATALDANTVYIVVGS